MSICSLLSRFVAPALVFSLVAASSAGFSQTKPVVISTMPANMAKDVSPDLMSYSITFSEPMDTFYGALSTNGWPFARHAWSADRKTITATRESTDSLPARFTYEIYLNQQGVNNQYMFRDLEGNFLDYFTFSFTIAGEGPPTGLSKIPANPAKGFSWPYYLYIPKTINSPQMLLVQPNNTGTANDDPAAHDTAAKGLIQGTRFWADQLGCPYLIPTFPRPETLAVGYTHALDRDALTTTVSGYERLDLQLIAMIDDARSQLAVAEIEVSPKVFMIGASASGSFVSRFVMLHPDRVKAASIGSPGFGPCVPVSSWNGQTLPYPEGISDLRSLVGSGFDSASFKNVPLQVYVGDQDLNVDPWWDPSTNPTVALIIAAFGGRHLYQRWPRYEAAYDSATSLAQFVVFPEMGHVWPPWNYMQDFFENNRSSPHPPLPRPVQYKIYFPQVASFQNWETEVALVNTVAGATAIKGELQAFRESGGDPIESVSVEIPPGGRKEITVGAAFQHSAEIAYLAFVSDSGFLAGYTRFNQPGNRVSLPAAAGVQEGWFPKMERDGWTGLAFINIGNEPANVKVCAYGEDGAKIVEESLMVEPGKKIIGLMDQVFPGDISNARFFSFTADQKVIAFSVSGSSDGEMLDGLPTLGSYLR